MTAQDPFDRQPPPPLAQPVHAGPLPIAQARSKWPTVLGVLAIVLASIGMLGMIWGFLATFVLPQDPQAAAFQPPKAWTVASAPVWLALYVLLLVAGIGLLRRRRWSIRALRIWAVLDVLVTVVHLVASASFMAGMREQLSQQGGSAPIPPGFIEIMFVFGMCIGAIWGLGPPVFTLIWFSRRKIKEEVARWV